MTNAEEQARARADMSDGVAVSSDMLTPETIADWRLIAAGPTHGVNINSRLLTALLDAADELDRLRQEKRAEQVKRIKAEHLRIRVQGKSYCVVDGMEWPCLSIRNLEQPSEETVPSPPCPLPVGDRPYWMSADQWDPCACILLKDHDGPCKCSHFAEES